VKVEDRAGVGDDDHESNRCPVAQAMSASTLGLEKAGDLGGRSDVGTAAYATCTSIGTAKPVVHVWLRPRATIKVPRGSAPPNGRRVERRIDESDQRKESTFRDIVALGNRRNDDAAVDEVAAERFANLDWIALE